jgi:diacylglycerol kinase family enzyme
MDHPFGPLRLLADTAARALEPTLRELLGELESAGLAADVLRVPTAQIGPAALDSTEHGWRYLAVVGGDDAVSEAAGALAGGTAILGVVPAGAGSDFARTFGLDRSPQVLAKHLASEATMDIDVGVVRCVAPDGSARERRFANVAQVGYGADLIRREAGLAGRLGRVGRLLAAYASIAAVPRQDAEVEVAHTTATGPFANLVVANGQFHAGGAKVAPRGLPDDGRLNVQIYGGPPSQVFLLTARILAGEHLPDPGIREYQSPTVTVAPPVPVPVEADGRYLGRTPASFSLLPRALRLKI